MLLAFVLLAIVGVAMIIYGILRLADGGDKSRPRDEESRVEVVYRVPSVFDRRHKK